jgi:hypothetical protein
VAGVSLVTDIPLRVYGPAPLDGVNGSTLYTAPSSAEKTFIRDITFGLVGTTSTNVKLSIGSINDLGKRVVDTSITTSNAPYFLRPLWLMDAGETLQGIQTITTVPTPTAAASVVTSGTDTTAYASGNWTPTANTLYLLVVANGVASGTTALNPSSITGNGTWSLITQTTSTVASARNIGIAAYYWYSSVGGTLGTTTVNYASTQHSNVFGIWSIANTASGTVATPPWTSSATPVIQSAVAADTVAPGASSNALTVTMPNALQTGQVFFFGTKTNTTGAASTPATNFTEFQDYGFNDLTGSIASISGTLDYVTAPPWTSTTVGTGASVGASDTNARASLAFELVPTGFVSCMVSAIEVR